MSDRAKKIADLEFYLMQGLTLLNELKQSEAPAKPLSKKKEKEKALVQDALMRRNKTRLKKRSAA